MGANLGVFEVTLIFFNIFHLFVINSVLFSDGLVENRVGNIVGGVDHDFNFIKLLIRLNFDVHQLHGGSGNEDANFKKLTTNLAGYARSTHGRCKNF